MEIISVEDELPSPFIDAEQKTSVTLNDEDVAKLQKIFI